MPRLPNRPSRLLGRLWLHVSRRTVGTTHRHPELELNFVLSGRARYELEGRSYEIVPNTMVWLFPGQLHVLLDRSPKLELIIAMFRPELVGRFSTQPDHRILREANPAEAFCRMIPAREAAELRRLYTDPLWLSNDVDGINAGLGYVLTRSWSAFCASATHVHGMELHPAVERAVRLLAEVGHEDRFDAVARHCGLSASRLAAVFQRQVGVTPGKFRTSRRLQSVLENRGEGNRFTWLEAALAAGFSSYVQFYRAFRKHYGVSPRQYSRRREKTEISSSNFSPALIASQREP